VLLAFVVFHTPPDAAAMKTWPGTSTSMATSVTRPPTLVGPMRFQSAAATLGLLWAVARPTALASATAASHAPKPTVFRGNARWLFI